MTAQRIERFGESDEVARNELGSLMNQLVERVLPVRSRLAPINRTGLIGDLGTVDPYVLAVTLHRQLLQVSRESLQVLFVRQDSDSLGPKEVVVPNGQKSHQHRQIAFKRRRSEMLIHLVKAGEHVAEIIRANGDHCRKPDRRI